MVHNGTRVRDHGRLRRRPERPRARRRRRVQAGVRCRDDAAPRAEVLRYDLDIPEIAEVWRRGSVVASWLLDLTAAALAEDPKLEAFSGRVSDSGEGRWTVLAAVDEGVPVRASASLFDRFESRQEAEFANRILSAMRKQFGGHAEKKD